jgi:Zn-dependent peptidase ImmA (M78 family)/predicted secreted protein
MSRREILIEAMTAASRLHRQLNSEEIANQVGGGIDVFGAISQLAVTLVFQPLDGLLGAFMSRPAPGIIVTTNRGLAVQRLTAAHELGHFQLKHPVSLDTDAILDRRPFGSAGYDLRELAADAFAIDFLMPEWLLESHAIRQGWTAESFDDARVVYQLALRIGASYEATCRTLQRYNTISSATLNKHLAVPRRRIKQELLGSHRLDNWTPNVWVLSERDRGTLIQGGPNDVFLIHLHENSGAGYLWNVEQLEQSGFVIVSDEVQIANDEVGGPVSRVLMATSQFPNEGQFELEQRQPWDPAEVSDRFMVRYQMFGKESGTLPRLEKMKKLAAVA